MTYLSSAHLYPLGRRLLFRPYPLGPKPYPLPAGAAVRHMCRVRRMRRAVLVAFALGAALGAALGTACKGACCCASQASLCARH